MENMVIKKEYYFKISQPKRFVKTQTTAQSKGIRVNLCNPIAIGSWLFPQIVQLHNSIKN